jgi:NitT/TauT family transport system substrate-binding protein
MRKGLLAAGVAAVAVLAAGCGSSGSSGSSGANASPVVLRLGFLANITHEPALVGLEKSFFAKQLGKSEITVRNQLSSIYRKLGIDTRHKLIAAFARLDI